MWLVRQSIISAKRVNEDQLMEYNENRLHGPIQKSAQSRTVIFPPFDATYPS